MAKIDQNTLIFQIELAEQAQSIALLFEKLERTRTEITACNENILSQSLYCEQNTEGDLEQQNINKVVEAIRWQVEVMERMVDNSKNLIANFRQLT